MEDSFSPIVPSFFIVYTPPHVKGKWRLGQTFLKKFKKIRIICLPKTPHKNGRVSINLTISN